MTEINKKLIEKINFIWYEKHKPKRTVVDKYIGKLVTDSHGAKFLITGTRPTRKICQTDDKENPYIIQSVELLIGTEWVEWFDFIRNYNRMIS